MSRDGPALATTSSRGRRSLRVVDVQRAVWWTVVTWAALDRFAAERPWWTWALVAGLVGLVARPISGARLARPGRAWLASAASGILLPAAVLAVDALLRGLADGEAPRGWIRLLPWAAVLVVSLLDLGTLTRLGRLVGVEWLKIRRGALFRSGLLAALVVTLLAGLTHERLPGASGWTLAVDAFGTGQWAIEVFLLVLGATAISGESTGGTLKMMLPHAYRRSDWIIAKATVLVVAAFCFALVVAITSIGYASATDGLGDVTRELEPMFGEDTGEVEVFETADVMRSHLASTVEATLASLIATAFLGLVLSAMFDSVVASLCVSFLVFAGLKFADVLFGLSRTTLQDIYAWYPDELKTLTGKLGRALNERWDDTLLPAGLYLALVTAAVAVLFATRVFARRDLHA